MAQKFTGLEEAATQLGVSKDRLNQLREAGKIRAYRDGASWKFRADDIDKLERDGIPQIDPDASDLALDLDDDFAEAGAAAGGEQASSRASDLNLDEIDEPTVAGVEDDESDALAIDLDDDAISLSDSILLNEADLGTSSGRPPSTIIGRAELDADADLDLSPVEKAQSPTSDVKLAPGSDVLPSGSEDFANLPSPSGDFAGLDELEVDLEAESSRILSPEDVAKARSAAARKTAETSDLELAPSDSDAAQATSDIGLAEGAASGVGLTGLSALELEDDDDQVLGEGSDVTLSGESSGINIISPSDSGLALDEVALDLSGSTPMGSALDLGDVSAADSAVTAAGSRVGEDFQLTPLGEEGADEKDSSQVIALDELSEESAGSPLGAPVSESGMLSEDFGVGLAPGAVVVADATADTPFSMWNVMGLASCLLLLALCGMMLFDLLRNMWAWEQGVSGVSSTLLEVLNPFL
jgi:excisionase family DNA binding protein